MGGCRADRGGDWRAETSQVSVLADFAARLKGCCIAGRARVDTGLRKFARP